jgi:glycosyltransferase involved in cell wall biosynthesis
LIPQFGIDPAIYYHRQRSIKRGKISVFKQRDSRPPSQPSLVIGYVRRLVEEKGIEMLLQAASRLTGPWNLQILGDGLDRKRLEQIAQWLGITPRVTFDYKMPSNHLPHYFSGLDVLVLPSLSRPNWQEQFDRVLVEAMACDVITVGICSGAIPEVIGETGLTFAEGSVEEYKPSSNAWSMTCPCAKNYAKKGDSGSLKITPRLPLPGIRLKSTDRF